MIDGIIKLIGVIIKGIYKGIKYILKKAFDLLKKLTIIKRRIVVQQRDFKGMQKRANKRYKENYSEII